MPLEGLKGNLRLLPLVKIDWRQSTMSPEGRLTLKGKFKFGIGYVVTLPENFSLTGLAYAPTVTSFFMPDRPPKVEFIERQNLIERDSRQLLHVRAQNVKSLLLEGIRVPPLLLPQALAVEDIPADWDQTLTEFKAGADRLKQLAQGNKALAPFLREPLEEKQLFPAPGQKNTPLAVSLPLSFRRDKEAGALELIRVSGDQADGDAATEPRVFRITDLGLTYKLGDNQLAAVGHLPKKGHSRWPAWRWWASPGTWKPFPWGRPIRTAFSFFSPASWQGWSLKNPADCRR